MRQMPASSFRGWRIQARNVRALMMRDMMMRYGRDNIGFIWVIAEPMILTAGVMVVWSLTMGTQKSGVKLVEFVLTGYMPLTLWRHVTNSAVTLFRRSSSLLYHRSISLLDIVASKFALEFLGTSAALLIVWLTLYLAGIASGISNLDLLILGWLMMAWISGATALVIAAATEYSETLERFIQPIQYLLIPLSGAFALVDWLPPWAQRAMLLNPLVHCYEVFRAGYFGSIITTHYSVGYFCAWAFVITFLGLIFIKRSRSHVRLS